MFILALEGSEKENGGAYTAIDSNGEQILYLFEEEDDATRFSMLLSEDGYPETKIMEVDDELIIKTCHYYDYNYAIFTKNDLVIPPKQNDSI